MACHQTWTDMAGAPPNTRLTMPHLDHAHAITPIGELRRRKRLATL
jgi:hypothetical protein